MKKDKDIIWTIKELYEFACENGYEDFTVFSSDEGCPCNIFKSEITVSDECIYL